MRDFLQRAVFWFTRLTGPRRYGAAWLLGIMAGLAFPPFNAIPLAFIAFPALIVLLRAVAGKRQAFALGWCFAFGLLTLNMYWIAGALFVDITKFWWVLPFALLGLPALFALYYGLAALLAARYGLQRSSGLIVFALLWFAADYARGHLFTGFPWALTGYVWGDILPVMQITSLIGIYGLSLLSCLIFLTPLLWLQGKTARMMSAVVLAGFVGLSLWGGVRLAQAERQAVPDVRLRIIQADINQGAKWQASQREANFQRLLDTTFLPAADRPVTHYVWPETATPFYLLEDPDRRQRIADRMAPGSLLLTGLVRRAPQWDGSVTYNNSLIAMDDRATVVAGYDKFHLVPFGEYFPFRAIMPGGVITALGVDFTPGEGPQTLRTKGLPPFSPLICYEAIFPDAVIAQDDPPQLLVNVTNDAWYDHTVGPYQHYLIARTRAIEEGVPLIRVANKGYTAVVDPYGRDWAMIGPETAGFVDSDLPQALPQPSLLSQIRPYGLLGLVGLMLLLLGIGRVFYRA
jgi:apolipoprotein N-acyltransferase